MNISSDDRRLAFFDIFPETRGQVNIVHLHAGAICAWHRHENQTDHYFCVAGTVKVGIALGLEQWTFTTLDARNPKVLSIPPGNWHGYQAIRDATLLQYLDHKYDATDEERHPAGEEWDRISR